MRDQPAYRRLYHRLGRLCIILVCFFAGTASLIYALRSQMMYFYSPRQIMESEYKSIPQRVRVGGIVRPQSIYTHQGQFCFQIHDFIEKAPPFIQMTVCYQGPLPGLFGDGQGVIAEGYLDKNRHFQATRLLVKHDETYRIKR